MASEERKIRKGEQACVLLYLDRGGLRGRAQTGSDDVVRVVVAWKEGRSRRSQSSVFWSARGEYGWADAQISPMGLSTTLATRRATSTTPHRLVLS